MPQFYITITRDKAADAVRSQIYHRLPETGRYWLDLSRRFHPNTLTARKGRWTTPWPMVVHPQLAMPAYDPGFTGTFADISDQRACEIRDLVRQGRRVALYYSGGIDSTVCAVALLKNLTAEELKDVAFCCNINSAAENPAFFERHIRRRVTILDSNRTKYSDLIAQGYSPITADTGDDIFGTEQATQFYFSYPKLVDDLPGSSRARCGLQREQPQLMEQPYAHFEDLLIPYLSPPIDPSTPSAGCDRRVGEWVYHKIVHNIATSDVPIHSLHDFFWWIIFNLRFTHCSLRGPLFYYMGTDLKGAITKHIINWFNTPNYQRWSMVNNNNGQKICKPTATHYKWAARCYIHDFDHNRWYFNYKIKSVSLYSLIQDNYDAYGMMFGLDSDYQTHWLSAAPVQRLFEEGLQNFEG